jgi:tRNA G18 (ribose-2'-O)-methylase SpoU
MPLPLTNRGQMQGLWASTLASTVSTHALNLIEITDLADPRVADYAEMRDAELRHRETGESPGGRFMAEGELVVRRLIDSACRPLSILLTPTRLGTLREALDLLPDGTPVYVADQRLMNSIAGFNIHRGVLASAERPRPADPVALLRHCRLLLALENLTNHDNVGGIFRSVAALAGAGAGILLSPGCCDPLYRKSIRVSMGHVLHVPFATLDPWPGGLGRARAAGWTILALTPAPDAISIESLTVSPGDRLLLLLGSEGPGLTPGATAASDRRVRIPISPDVDSLNVGIAAAIAMHRMTAPPPLTAGPAPPGNFG